MGVLKHMGEPHVRFYCVCTSHIMGLNCVHPQLMKSWGAAMSRIAACAFKFLIQSALDPAFALAGHCCCAPTQQVLPGVSV